MAGACECGNEPSGSKKNGRNSASEEGLCSMEVVSNESEASTYSKRCHL
jgi:hypothetical protein